MPRNGMTGCTYLFPRRIASRAISVEQEGIECYCDTLFVIRASVMLEYAMNDSVNKCIISGVQKSRMRFISFKMAPFCSSQKIRCFINRFIYICIYTNKVSRAKAMAGARRSRAFPIFLINSEACPSVSIRIRSKITLSYPCERIAPCIVGSIMYQTVSGHAVSKWSRASGLCSICQRSSDPGVLSIALRYWVLNESIVV